MWDILKERLTKDDVANCLEFIVAGKPNVRADFTDVPMLDPELDAIRVRVLKWRRYIDA
jgi:hypothetical protein